MLALLRRSSSVTAHVLASPYWAQSRSAGRSAPITERILQCSRPPHHHAHQTSHSIASHASKGNKDSEIEFESLEDAPTDEELGFTSGDFEHIIVENDEWGKKALECAMDILGRDETLELYSFRAMSGRKCVDIRIDKLTDQFGSPSLDEIGAFSREFNELFEATIGEDAAGDIEIEVSSPGATRAVKIPHELLRFSSLPMVVCSKDAPEPRILDHLEVVDDSVSVWKYADVKANRALGKGRGLSKKQKEMKIEIPLGDLVSVNLHIDL